MAFSFVHAADLHLDSPFRALAAEDPHVAKVLSEATFEAFERLVELCLQRKPLFLAVAGDVYDEADRGVRAQLRFLNGLRVLDAAGVRSFVVHGNHDPHEAWSHRLRWPEGAHIFGTAEPETVRVEQAGAPVAAVTGISYAARRVSENLAARFTPAHPGLFQVALLHCNCGGNAAHADYAPCALNQLAGAGFDYWALGHVHTRAILNTEPHVVYPGNPQGLHINEQGPRGCYVVEVDDRNRVARAEFVPLDGVRWAQCSVAIDGIDSIDALAENLLAALEALRAGNDGRHVVCRLRLEGRGPLYETLRNQAQCDGLLEELRRGGVSGEPFVWVEKLDFHCGPAIDLEAQRQEQDLLAALLEEADRLARAPDLKEALAPAFDTLHSWRAASGGIQDPSREELEALLQEAVYLCASLLRGAP